MTEVKSIDEVIEITGGFGKFQWRLLTMMSFCMALVGLNALSMTFITISPTWKCRENSTICKYNSTVLPAMSNYEQKCKMNESEWIYTNPEISIISKFRLHCDRSILKYAATSMIFLGWFCGAIVFGFISDKFGRRIALLISIIICSVAELLSIFPNIFWIYAFLKFLVGAGLGGNVLCTFVLSTEYTGPKKRALAGVIVWNTWTVGLLVITLCAYLLQDWKHITLFTACPGFLAILFCYYIPESARWYLVMGRSADAIQVLRQVAKVNKGLLSDEITLEETNIQSSNNGNILQVFESCSLTINTLICLLLWFTCSMTYYGVSLSSGSLGANIYVAFGLTSVVSIPGHFAAGYLMNRFGRKKIIILTLVLTAIFLIGASIFPTGKTVYTVLRIICAMIAKFATQILFDTAYVITYEIFPTSLRNVAMGFSSASARLGSFSASYIIFLKSINPILPFLIFGAICFISALTCLILPETNNTPTKETINNAIDTDTPTELQDEMLGNENTKL